MMSQVSQGTEVCHQERRQNPSEVFQEQFLENSPVLSVCNLNVVLVSSPKSEVLVGNGSVQNHVPYAENTGKAFPGIQFSFPPSSLAQLLTCSAPRSKSCPRGRIQSPNRAQPRESWKGRDLYINCKEQVLM